eukprot:COSAG04_NODE_15942_length_515_cov_0.622596_1_plen_92_part_10
MRQSQRWQAVSSRYSYKRALRLRKRPSNNRHTDRQQRASSALAQAQATKMRFVAAYLLVKLSGRVPTKENMSVVLESVRVGAARRRAAQGAG